MKAIDIQVGETYMFVATDAPARKSLEGHPFKVVDIRPVWRRRDKISRRVKRFFNEDGVGARADELEPLDEGRFACDHCGKVSNVSEVAIDDDTGSADKVYEVCPNCGERIDPF